MSEDTCHPVDDDGLVVLSSVWGDILFLDGHTGEVRDGVPPWIHDVLAAVKSGDPGRLSAMEALHGPEVGSWVTRLQAVRRPDRRALDPDARQIRLFRPFHPYIFNVYVSQTCNLRCAYCFHQHGTFGARGRIMRVDTARATARWIRERLLDGPGGRAVVNLFGGEPLLAPRAARVLARSLQDLNHAEVGTSLHLLLCTNGTVWDDEVFGILRERPDRSAVVVSLDAVPEIHDRNRPFADPRGGSTFSVVLANLRRMQAEGIPFSVVCVVPDPHDFVGAAQALTDLGIPRFEIKGLNHHVYGQAALPAVFHRDLAAWREAYTAYADAHVARLSDPATPHHVDRNKLHGEYVLGLRQSRRIGMVLACRAADGKVGIAADGRILPCESFLGHAAWELGDVRRGLDPERVAAVGERLLAEAQHRIDHPRCRACFARLVCGGGCYAQAWDRTGGLEPPDPSACAFIREKVRIDLHYLSRVRRRFPALARPWDALFAR